MVRNHEDGASVHFTLHVNAFSDTQSVRACTRLLPLEITEDVQQTRNRRPVTVRNRPSASAPMPTRSPPQTRYRGDGAPELRRLLSPPPSWTSPGSASSSQKPGERAAWRRGRRRTRGERLAGCSADRKGRSIFTPLWLCMCAQPGRRALRLCPPLQPPSSRCLPGVNQWQSKKGGEEETEG